MNRLAKLTLGHIGPYTSTHQYQNACPLLPPFDNNAAVWASIDGSYNLHIYSCQKRTVIFWRSKRCKWKTKTDFLWPFLPEIDFHKNFIISIVIERHYWDRYYTLGLLMLKIRISYESLMTRCFQLGEYMISSFSSICWRSTPEKKPKSI